MTWLEAKDRDGEDGSRDRGGEFIPLRNTQRAKAGAAESPRARNSAWAVGGTTDGWRTWWAPGLQEPGMPGRKFQQAPL